MRAFGVLRVAGIAVLLFGCVSYHDVYRTAAFSPAHRDGSSVRVGLQFLRVDPDSTVVMRYKTSVWWELRAKPGRYLSGRYGATDLRVISASPHDQTAVVKYRYSTARRTM